MEKSRKIKILSIAALVLAVIGMTLGFASFQKIMKISSSATVKLPLEEDFDVAIYGITNMNEINDLSYENFDSLSKNKAYAFNYNENVFNADYYASINNNDFTIDINNLVFKKPGEIYNYFFVLKNNSDYGVYVYLSDESRASYSNGWRGICTADEGTTQELVDTICNKITLMIGELLFNGNNKLSAGESLIFSVSIGYSSKNDDRADGPFSVSFDPIKIEFDTVPHTYENVNTVIEEDA